MNIKINGKYIEDVKTRVLKLDEHTTLPCNFMDKGGENVVDKLCYGVDFEYVLLADFLNLIKDLF